MSSLPYLTALGPEPSTISHLLPPNTSKLDRYKLETAFEGDDVIHTEYMSDLAAGQRKKEIKTRWRWEKDIGEGGFGVVWLQKEVGTGRLRAVKRVSHRFRGTDWSRELTTLSKVKEHQDLFVQILGWYENKDFVFLAMEYIENGDLSQYLEKFGPKAKAEAKEIIGQLAEGLEVIHGQDICHRDLKPQNILIAAISPIWVKITDFGVAKREKNTSLRTNCGTPGYLAPEVLGFLPQKFKKGILNSYTQAVDLWSLGVITHQILTSEIPFLQKIQPISPESGLYSTTETPEVDMELFFGYCQGFEEFPISSLQNSQVGKDGINFVVKLLVVNPSARMSAENALKSPWLSGNGESNSVETGGALTLPSDHKDEPHSEPRYRYRMSARSPLKSSGHSPDFAGNWDLAETKEAPAPPSEHKSEPCSEPSYSYGECERSTEDQEKLNMPDSGDPRERSRGESLIMGLAGLPWEKDGTLSDKARSETILRVVTGLTNYRKEESKEESSTNPPEQPHIDALLRGIAGIAPGGYGRLLRRKYQ